MKIRKREELEALNVQNGSKNNQTRGQAVKSDKVGLSPEEAARVEIAVGRDLSKIAEGPSNSEKVQMLKRIFNEEGAAALNARYASEDVAGALASELDSFVNDFRERE